MPRLDDNLEVWNTTYDWSTEGEEWSATWGGTAALWYGALLPRIHPFVPAGTILEIAPGYGRWTQYLKDLADELVLVDLAQGCIDHCRRRFADSAHIEYHVNDGRSLEMVPDGSVDFAFSFDSLVHAEADVLNAYLEQLARKLAPDGVGFFHHSNAGRHRSALRIARKVPSKKLGGLVVSGAVINLPAWRAESVTAELVAQQCDAAGLACVTQEQISWDYGRYLIDAISIFTPRGSRYERPNVVRRNPFFTSEARRMRDLYAASSFPGARGPNAGDAASNPPDGA